jgi:hypothetical protein
MESFLHLDFIGDTALRLLAFKKRPAQPDIWVQRFGSNRFLARIYNVIFGKGNRIIKPQGYKRRHKSSRRTVHIKASHVESWLGIAYINGGLSEVEKCWERMMVILKTVKKNKLNKGN